MEGVVALAVRACPATPGRLAPSLLVFGRDFDLDHQLGLRRAVVCPNSALDAALAVNEHDLNEILAFHRLK